MNQLCKKVFTCMLSVVLTFGLCPTVALADEVKAKDPADVAAAVEEPAEIAESTAPEKQEVSQEVAAAPEKTVKVVVEEPAAKVEAASKAEPQEGTIAKESIAVLSSGGTSSQNASATGEDSRFAALNLVNVTASFVDEGNYPWVLSDGKLVSSNQGADRSSSVTEIRFSADGQIEISFDWSVSSESGCDRFTVSVDGESRISESGASTNTSSFELLAGPHVLRLSYSKDDSFDNGEDCAKVSNLRISSPCGNGHAAVNMPAVEPTCTESGRTAGSICSVCGAVIEGCVERPAFGHNYVNGPCSRCGEYEVIASGSKIGSYRFGYFDDYASEPYSYSWSLDSRGVFSVEGFGALDANYFDDRPWQDHLTEIKQVVIGEGITYIGRYAFSDCSNLISVSFPSTLIGIDEYAFRYCSVLPSVAIPESVAAISYFAFGGCPCLKTVHAASMESWLNIKFGDKFNQSGSANPCCNGGTLYVNGEVPTRADFPSTTEKISNYALYGCKYITEVTIPEGVTSIGAYAFYGCKRLESINIPSTVGSIGESAFYGCEALQSANIPVGVTQINRSTFYGCKSLTSITIPSTVKLIRGNAFSDCEFLKFVYADSLDAWLGITFDEWSSHPCGNGASLYLGGQLLTNLVIPEGTEELSTNAFYGCSSITSVSLPTSLKKVGGSAFYNCKQLQSVSFAPAQGEANPQGCSIGNSAFSGCASLASLNFGNRVDEIGESAFNNCDSLVSVIIPGSVGMVGSQSFWDCDNLKTVVMQEGVKDIGSSAFSSCYKLESVSIPSTVQFIRQQAFGYCHALSTLELKPGLVGIGKNAFYYCNSLTQVNIPVGVTIVDDYAFRNCSKLTGVFVPHTVEYVGLDAFNGVAQYSTIYVSAVETAPLLVDSYSATNTAVELGSLTPRAKGDVNGSGSINIVDAQLAYDMATGQFADSIYNGMRRAADVAGTDAQVDSQDAFRIQRVAILGEEI